jgi:hypothetical protein
LRLSSRRALSIPVPNKEHGFHGGGKTVEQTVDAKFYERLQIDLRLDMVHFALDAWLKMSPWKFQ